MSSMLPWTFRSLLPSPTLDFTSVTTFRIVGGACAGQESFDIGVLTYITPASSKFSYDHAGHFALTMFFPLNTNHSLVTS